MDKKVHVCNVEGCHAKFSRPYRLQQHLRVHNGEKPFRCTHSGCNRSYTNNSHLRRHVSAAHQEHKSLHKCTFAGCTMLLRHASNIKRHIERCHKSQQERFPCSLCSASFTKKRQLLAHSYVHTGIPPFRCESCNMGFLSSGLLNKHILTHRQYYCDFPECKTKNVFFNKRNAYRKHRKECHRQTYSCAHCLYQTSNKSAINVHVIQHLNLQVEDAYSCPYAGCGKHYFYLKNLKGHIHRVHKGNRFSCPNLECGKTLSTKAKLQLHLKMHEPGYKACSNSTKGKIRAKRKDIGIPQRSYAVKLSGVELAPAVERVLLKSSGDLTKLCAQESQVSKIDSEPHHSCVDSV